MTMTEPKKAKNWLQLALVGVLILASFAIGSMWTELKFLRSNQKPVVPTAQQAVQQAQPQPEEVKEVTQDVWQEILQNPAATRGNQEAKVTLVEFTDYQCPFCERHFTQTEGLLDKEYIETGKVRYIIHDLALSFHPNAHQAAEAARCAGVQEKYFEFHDKLFGNQAEWSSLEPAAAASKFGSYAESLGLDTTKFNSCLTNGEQKAAVDADIALAGKAGLNGTPSFVINGKVLIGAQPFSVFKTMLDEALK